MGLEYRVHEPAPRRPGYQPLSQRRAEQVETFRSTETRSFVMTSRAITLKTQPRQLTVKDVWDVLGFVAFGLSVLFILALIFR